MRKHSLAAQQEKARRFPGMPFVFRFFSSAVSNCSVTLSVAAREAARSYFLCAFGSAFVFVRDQVKGRCDEIKSWGWLLL
jgi:hypothetical protein